MNRSSLALVGVTCVICILACPLVAAPSEWLVSAAPIRFAVDLTEEPSHASAGYFITLPDGGILPGPAPDAKAYDEAGAPLKSGLLWYNRSTGAGLVVEKPKKGSSITIYVASASKSALWSPESGLTPSVIFCAKPGSGSRDDAFRLAGLGAVETQVQYCNQGVGKVNFKGNYMSLAFWDRSFGRPGKSALYMLAHVDVIDPGATWIAPVSVVGQMEVAIDGKLVHTFKTNEKRGGTGTSINLTRGLHRVELYGYNNAGEMVGPMMLMWRTPKTTVAELGGVRESQLRYPGTPMCEARTIKNEEVVTSGSGVIRQVQARDGGPVAWCRLDCNNTFWFAGEQPLLQYSLHAGTQGNPSNTLYTWRFTWLPGAEAKGAAASWLFPGDVDQVVTLTAQAGEKRSEASVSFLAVAHAKSSIDNASTRASFRRSCLEMLKAYPVSANPVAAWPESMWNNLFRVLDIDKEDPLVEYIVTQRWEFFRKKLTPERKAQVEDTFLVSMSIRKPKEALSWIDEFLKDSPTQDRSVELQLKKAEILMYYLDDLKQAREVITPLLSASGEPGEWARIRMGDLELLSRNINEATRRYGDVQGRSKPDMIETGTMPRKLTHAGLSGPVKSSEFAKRKAPQITPAKEAGGMSPPPAVADWKLGAIKEVAATETVDSLIDQEYFREALLALKSWERFSPMSKITGDFILKEAKLYWTLKDYKRARVMLSAYCEQVDASNFLPEALKMIVNCMIYMNEPESVVKKYEQEIKKRLEPGTGEQGAMP